MKNRIAKILSIVFSIIFMLSCMFLVGELVIRRHAMGYTSGLQSLYSPQIPSGSANSDILESGDKTDTSSATSKTVVEDNPSIQEMVANYPDAIGWLTVAGADVSHPFVIGTDNDEYLHADLDRNYIVSGTLFLDFRSSRDLTDGLTVLYGHHMTDKTMFGKLDRYCDTDFLIANPDVFVSLPHKTVHYTAFACMIVDPNTSPFYANFGRTDNIQDIVDYITDNADYLNTSVEVNGESKILALSTCYFSNRAVLLCVMD